MSEHPFYVIRRTTPDGVTYRFHDPIPGTDQAWIAEWDTLEKASFGFSTKAEAKQIADQLNAYAIEYGRTEHFDVVEKR